jgi:hypothetical protein
MMTDKDPLGDPPPPGEGGEDSLVPQPGDPPPPGGDLESGLESPLAPGDPPPPGEEEGDPPPPGPITK